MNPLQKSGRVFFTIYAMLVFVVLMLVVLPFVIVASFFGKIRGGNFIYKVCSVWSCTWLFLIGIRYKNIYLSNRPSESTCIFVANHISYMDVPFLVAAIRQPIRVLGKVELSRIPIFGYVYRKATVMVDRSSTENRAKSVKILKSILKRGISIVIFPEGTFNETGKPLSEFYNGAFRIAIETQTPIRPVVFVDTIDRMHYRSIFSLNPGILRAVFLEEVPVSNLTMRDMNSLKQLVFNKMESTLVEWRKL